MDPAVAAILGAAVTGIVGLLVARIGDASSARRDALEAQRLRDEAERDRRLHLLDVRRTAYADYLTAAETVRREAFLLAMQKSQHPDQPIEVSVPDAAMVAARQARSVVLLVAPEDVVEAATRLWGALQDASAAAIYRDKDAAIEAGATLQDRYLKFASLANRDLRSAPAEPDVASSGP
jgi:hypothetical protein